MPFQRKTLSTLISEVAADIASSLKGADALLRFAVLKVIGKIQAAMCNLQFGYLDWVARMAVPFTSEDEYLEGWAALKDVYRKAAEPAQLTASFPGTPGKELSAGTPIVRGDGFAYTASTTGTVGVDNAVTVTITANQGGVAGNSDPGTTMTLGAALDGIQTTGAVVGNVEPGTDIESNDELRSRMLDAFQKPVQGGDKDDYIEWARAVPGVTRAWCRPNGAGAGTVVVYTMFDDAEAAHGGFPQGTNGVSQFDQGPDGLPRDAVATGDQLTVADAIVRTQPVTALVYSCAPQQNVVPFTISGLSSSTSVTRAAIAAAIDDVFFRDGDPTGATAYLSDIESAIAAISGTKGFVITTPVGNITSAIGFLPVRGTVTYT